MAIPPLVIIDNLYLLRSILPDEADPPLIVNANAPLPDAVALQGFQAVSGRVLEVVQAAGIVKLAELAQRHTLDVRRERARSQSQENALRLPAFERPDHTL